MIDAVIFDLGGVVFESPLAVIAEYEDEQQVTAGTINQVVMEAGPGGAWAQYERAEITHEEFCRRFAEECAQGGARVDVESLMGRIDHATRPRPKMLDTLSEVRARGWLVAALTNNWVPLSRGSFTDRFDVVVESSVEGVRKPQPRIYELVIERLGVKASAALFLDDIGANLKPARAMGMTTIKVVEVDAAIDEMWRVLQSDRRP